MLFFFVFLGIAFILDKYFSKTGVGADVAEVHRQPPGEQPGYDAVTVADKRECWVSSKSALQARSTIRSGCFSRRTEWHPL